MGESHRGVRIKPVDRGCALARGGGAAGPLLPPFPEEREERESGRLMA